MRAALSADLLIAIAVGMAVLVPARGWAPATFGWAAAGAVAFVIFIALTRGYEIRSLGDGPGEFQAVLRGGLLVGASLTMFAFTLQAPVPRSAVFFGVPALIVAAFVGRHLRRRSLHSQRRVGRAMMQTLIVGEPGSIERLLADLTSAPHHGYQVVGICLPSLDMPEDGLPILGAIADVPQVVVDHAIDVVIVTGHYLGGEALRRLSWALGRTSAQLVVAPDLVEVTGPRLSLRPTLGLSLLEVEIGTSRRRLVGKAILDRSLGAVLLAVALPVILAAALAARRTSPGPAFYSQTRVGVDGRTFKMWKIRSMYIDADARREALLAVNEGHGLLFKVRNDPRVTPLGRVLRRYSLDELPQLLNVVKGDMSLVGPRPPLLEEVAQYEDQVQRRLHVRPGLTGLWQVSGRSNLSWEESMRLDLRYVDNWSVMMDLLILWKTARAVLAGSGAF